MTATSPSWYIPGEGKKPVGPFTAEQIIESWRAGRLTEKTLCWQEGMAKWLPLAEVEPFAAAIRPAAAPRKGGVFRRLTIRGFILAGVAIAGAVLYVYWQEATTIHKAKSLIAAGDCEEALALLWTFQHETYFYHYSQEPEYLLALAATRQYALTADPKDLPEEPLEKPRRQFKDLFRADERWRNQAKADLADVIAGIPKKAPDDLARAVILVGFLQELKVAEAKQLAKGLFVRLKARVDAGHTPEDGDAAVIGWILRLNPSLAVDLVATVLQDSGEMPQQVRSKLASVQHWAHEWPSLAKVLATGLVQRATDLSRMGKRQTACLLLDAAEAMYPELCEQCARKRLEWVKKDLAENDYAGVLRGLDGMHINSYSATISAEAASLFLKVAQQASKMNPALAQRAMDRAFQLQPTFGDSEPNVLLWINLHSEPSSEKLQQCQHFLSTFNTSEHRSRIQMEIVCDAVALARSGGAWNAKHYLDAAYTQATAILEKEPPIKELEPQAWVLAQCLANAERYDRAVHIAELFRKVFPDTPLKQEIEGMVATWRAVPKSGPRADAPSGRGRQETLEAKLLRRKRTISTSTAIYDAVANKEIWIIEVADTCTADQFDAEQARLLRDWVSDGGVLWVNSNVLDLFGIRHSTVSGGSFAHCVSAAGTHPILEGVTTVRVDDLQGKSLSLNYRGVIPLLSVKEEGRNPYWEPPAGTAVWSLVPYGKGWISDRKPLHLDEEHNTSWSRERDRGQEALFWGQFCQFCLHELPWPPPASGSNTLGEQPPESLGQNALTGTWQASTGAQFRIEDDGKTITIDLATSDTLRVFSGKLTRPDEQAEAKSLTGTLNAVFAVDAPKQYTIRVSATINDDSHLRLRCENWPQFDRRTGRYTGRGVLNELWTRSDGSLPGLDRPSRWRGPRSGDPSAPGLMAPGSMPLGPMRPGPVAPRPR